MQLIPYPQAKHGNHSCNELRWLPIHNSLQSQTMLQHSRGSLCLHWLLPREHQRDYMGWLTKTQDLSNSINHMAQFKFQTCMKDIICWYLDFIITGSLPWTKQDRSSYGIQRLSPSTANMQMLARILPDFSQHIVEAGSESSHLNVNTVGAERNPLVAINVKRLVLNMLIIVISKWGSTKLGVSMLWKANQSNHNAHKLSTMDVQMLARIWLVSRQHIPVVMGIEAHGLWLVVCTVAAEKH